MALISSISGIRGTIGNCEKDKNCIENTSNCLTSINVVKYVSAYACFLKAKNNLHNIKVIVGRDGRVSGQAINNLVISTLIMSGIDVVDIGLTTTPTVEIIIEEYNASGGIMISASHNPMQWNALKLFNEKGEFICSDEGKEVDKLYNESCGMFVAYNKFGKLTEEKNALKLHVDKILALPYLSIVNKFRVAVDGINSSGAFAVPYLLEKMGIQKDDIFLINSEQNGDFAHDPEPLDKNLSSLKRLVVDKKCSLGIAVDPDVDRLAFVDEKGNYVGEEYTIVLCADFVLNTNKGNVVSNLSSSRALKDLAYKHSCQYFSSAVGEVNVVKKMKDTNAIIGGEGNGGVILPELHYGRDALLGIALAITYLSESNLSLSEIRKFYNNYFMVKDKINLATSLSTSDYFLKIKPLIKDRFMSASINEEDGLKLDFADSWVHIRISNTEPVFRIYAEAVSIEKAKLLVNTVKEIICVNVNMYK